MLNSFLKQIRNLVWAIGIVFFIQIITVELYKQIRNLGTVNNRQTVTHIIFLILCKVSLFLVLMKLKYVTKTLFAQDTQTYNKKVFYLIPVLSITG